MANAPPLVLSPGLLCGRDLWAAQFDTPADVAAMTVGDLTRNGSMAGMAARVLAGSSKGGYAASEVLRRATERVTRLAPIDTSARPDAPEQAARRRGASAARPSSARTRRRRTTVTARSPPTCPT